MVDIGPLRRIIRTARSAGAAGDSPYLSFNKPDHTLLRRLRLAMPGTYEHSRLVADMAEAAGRVVRADADLIRCIATYHDIGKLLHPELYLEGRSGDRNKLREISNKEDLDAVLAHPRAAQLILSDYDFPSRVLIAVAEHHGDIMTRLKIDTRLRARLKAEQLHYPGPRPSSRESAIVMLADSVEAVVNRRRTSPSWPAEPSREFIGAIVRQIGGELRQAGQFQEVTFFRIEQWLVEKGLTRWLYDHYQGCRSGNAPGQRGPV